MAIGYWLLASGNLNVVLRSEAKPETMCNKKQIRL